MNSFLHDNTENLQIALQTSRCNTTFFKHNVRDMIWGVLTVTNLEDSFASDVNKQMRDHNKSLESDLANAKKRVTFLETCPAESSSGTKSSPSQSEASSSNGQDVDPILGQEGLSRLHLITVSD